MLLLSVLVLLVEKPFASSLVVSELVKSESSTKSHVFRIILPTFPVYPNIYASPIDSSSGMKETLRELPP